MLGFDLERSVLRRRRAELGARLEEATRAAEGAPAGEKAAAERHAARVQKRCEEAEALLAELGDEEAAEAKAAAILAGLQFGREMMRAPLHTLSGGWRMRVTLAAALFVPCDILLLDEPTNHLDFPALSWLTKWLKDKCKATLLVVSHDRGFLDEVVTDVVQLRGRNLTTFRGDITSYVKTVDEQKREQKRRFEAQQAERKHMQEMIDKYDPSKNSREDNKKNKRHAGVLAQAKQRDRQLAKMEEEGLIADPDAKSDEATIALRFPPPPPLKKPLLASLDGASFRYPTPDGTLAKGAPLLRELRLSVSLGERIGVLGRRSRVAESGMAAGGGAGLRCTWATTGQPPLPSPPGPRLHAHCSTPTAPRPLLHAHCSTRPTRGQQAALSTRSRHGKSEHHGRSEHRACASRPAALTPGLPPTRSRSAANPLGGEEPRVNLLPSCSAGRTARASRRSCTCSRSSCSPRAARPGSTVAPSGPSSRSTTSTSST